MERNSKILGVWIIDEISRIILVQRTYLGEAIDEQVTHTLSSSIFSISNYDIEEGKSGTFLIGNRQIYYEKIQNLFFVVLVKKEYGVMDANRILSHLRVTFLRKYPIGNYSWQSNDQNQHFKSFENTIDEIVRHFGDIIVVAKIVLMGLDYAGKTTLAHSFIESKYEDYLPTKGLDIIKVEYRNMLLRLWDLGGQRQFWKLWPKFAAEASGIIFVIDSTTDRWTETKEAFEASKMLNLPFIIFANKQDIVDQAKTIEFISERLNVSSNLIITGSALLNIGNFEVIDQLIEKIQGVDLEEEVVQEEKKIIPIDIQIHEFGLRLLTELEAKGWIGIENTLLELRDLLKYKNLIILETELETENFKIKACEGEDCNYLRDFFSTKSKQQVLTNVLIQKEPKLISNIEIDSYDMGIEKLKNRSFSILIVPIFNQQHIWGVYLVYSDQIEHKKIKITSPYTVLAQYLAMGFKYLSNKRNP